MRGKRGSDSSGHNLAARVEVQYNMEAKASLLVVLLLVAVLLLGGSGGTLALDATGAATTVGRVEGKVDVLLGVEADDERGNVDDLLADAIYFY